MLTDTVIRAAKPAEKPRKLFDEKGLHLVVMPSGGRHHRHDQGARLCGRDRSRPDGYLLSDH